MSRCPPYELLTSIRYDPFLETLGWNNDDGQPSAFFLLPLHFDRLSAAARTHGWVDAESSLTYARLKQSCLNVVKQQEVIGGIANTSSTALRLRITVSEQGQIMVTATPLSVCFASDPTALASLFHPMLPLPNGVNASSIQQPTITSPLRIYIDSQATLPSIFTQTKTTSRSIYESAKTRTAPRACAKITAGDWDVLLYNTNGNYEDGQDGAIMETSIFNIAFYRSSTWLTPSTLSGCLPGVMRKWLLDNGRITEDHAGTLTKSSIIADEWVLVFNGVQGCRLGKICL